VIGSMISLGYYLPVIAAIWMRGPISDRSPAEERAGGGLQPRTTGEATIGPQPGGLPAIAGGSPELDAESTTTIPAATQLEVTLLAVLAGAATLFFGIVPGPLFDLVRHVGAGLGLF
jgi:NADH-quinone oxidoreductase subunit N